MEALDMYRNTPPPPLNSDRKSRPLSGFLRFIEGSSARGSHPAPHATRSKGFSVSRAAMLTSVIALSLSTGIGSVYAADIVINEGQVRKNFTGGPDGSETTRIAGPVVPLNADDPNLVNNGEITNIGTVNPANIEDHGVGVSFMHENAVITGNGAIKIKGRETAVGIKAEGNTAKITINGEINIKGIPAVVDMGLASDPNVPITNGSISAVGIKAEGDHAEITINGEININKGGYAIADRAPASGIQVKGDDNVITINEGATIRVTGSRTTNDDSHSGIELVGDNAVVINKGLITNVDPDLDLTKPENRELLGVGISGAVLNRHNSPCSTNSSPCRSTADNPTVINNGMIIIKSQDDARGIALSFPNGGARITNSGMIDVEGGMIDVEGRKRGNANGIQVDNADNVTVDNSGTITVRSMVEVFSVPAHGITISPGNEAMVTNSGTITVYNKNGVGIAVGYGITLPTGQTIVPQETHGVDKGRITSSGTVKVFGANAIGILASGRNSVMTLSGLVSSRASDADNAEFGTAIQGSSWGNQKLVLLNGQRILGGIDLGTGAGDILGDGPNDADGNPTGNIGDIIDLSQYTGPSFTYTRVEGVEDVLGQRAEYDKVQGILIFTQDLDHTGASATRMALGATTGQIHRQVSRRLALASDDGGGWGTLFGSSLKRDDDGQAKAWNHNSHGLIGGYDTRLDSGQQIGLFAGFGSDNIGTAKESSVTDKANRGFAGIYGQHVTGNLTVKGTLAFGHTSHTSTRFAALRDLGDDDETAKGKYKSTFISPSINLAWSHTLPNGFELRPSAHIAYTYGSFGGYTEAGTTNHNVTFGIRNENIVDGRLQLALAQPFADDRGEIEWRAGITGTHYGNSSVSAQLGGDNLGAAVPGDRSLAGGFVGAALDYAIEDRVNLNGSVEYSQRSGDASGGLSGQFGLVVKF